jgi:hypothetical protein
MIVAVDMIAGMMSTVIGGDTKMTVTGRLAENDLLVVGAGPREIGTTGGSATNNEIGMNPGDAIAPARPKSRPRY